MMGFEKKCLIPPRKIPKATQVKTNKNNKPSGSKKSPRKGR